MPLEHIIHRRCMRMQFVGVETGARSKREAANVDRKTAKALTLPVKKNGFVLTGQMAEGPCLAVIDFDLRSGHAEFPVAELPEACQKTMLVRTGSGGLHAYFY